MNRAFRVPILAASLTVILVGLGCSHPTTAVDNTIAPPPSVVINAPVEAVATAILSGKVMAGALTEGRLKVTTLPSGERDFDPVTNGMVNMCWKVTPDSPSSTRVVCGVFGGISTNAAGVWETRPLTENRTNVTTADAILHKTLEPLKAYVEGGSKGANPLDAAWSK